MSETKRNKIISLAYRYLTINGPSPAKAITEWIAAETKNGVSVSELTNYIRVDRRFKAVARRRYRRISGAVKVWAIT